MSLAIACAVVGLGWWVRRIRPWRSPAPARLLGSGDGASLVLGSLRSSVRGRWGVAATVPDPAPLLRFRTAIESGASVVQAFEAVAAGSDRWAPGAHRLVARVRAGAGVQEAVDGWVAEERDPSVRLLADALAISGSTGGSHVRAVDAVIDAVRERASLQREVRALASQAQTSAVVLLLLPIGFAVVIALLDPRVRAFYVGSALGPACVLGGCVLDALGAWLMLRLVRAVA